MNRGPWWRGAVLAGWLALTWAAALPGIFVEPAGYFAELSKPVWSPPAWIFAPAWTLLYVLMAVAAWRVWRCGGWKAQRGALSLYLGQLALNALWTPIFFGWRQQGWALAEIVLLWLAVGATWWVFRRIDRWAGWLLLPYWLWVTFAAALNFAIWRLAIA